MKAIILIPARMASTRLPAKPLALISGVPMIERVYKNMAMSELDVAVVTDHDEIEKCIKKINGKVFRVDDNVATGSERIGLAFEKFLQKENYQFIVNVQGDEPLLQAQTISALIKFHAASTFDITTLYYERNDAAEQQNPNIVKVALAQNSGKCLYFSRAAIPYYRQVATSDKKQWNQHVGVYCYKPNILSQFLKLPPSPLELAESLEQLRALESGFTMGALKTDYLPQSVDTFEDIAKVEKYFAKHKT